MTSRSPTATAPPADQHGSTSKRPKQLFMGFIVGSIFVELMHMDLGKWMEYDVQSPSQTLVNDLVSRTLQFQEEESIADELNFMENLTATERTASTTSQKYNFTTAICTMAMDAEAYLEEWLDYHLLAMEFDNVYIYDNSENNELQHWYQNTRNHSVYSRVEIVHDTNKQQQAVMEACIQRFGKNGPKHDYIALTDLDEFYVFQDGAPYTDIKGLLQDYLVPYGGGLTANWMMMGTANKTAYSPVPVTKRFQYREEEAFIAIKSIIQSSAYTGMAYIHGPRVKGGLKTTLQPGFKLNATDKATTIDRLKPSGVLLLYHYRYTSEKEYIFKRCNRGEVLDFSWCTPQGKLKGRLPNDQRMHPGVVHDDKAWKFLKSKVPKYRIYDEHDFEDYH